MAYTASWFLEALTWNSEWKLDWFWAGQTPQPLWMEAYHILQETFRKNNRDIEQRIKHGLSHSTFLQQVSTSSQGPVMHTSHPLHKLRHHTCHLKSATVTVFAPQHLANFINPSYLSSENPLLKFAIPPLPVPKLRDCPCGPFWHCCHPFSFCPYPFHSQKRQVQ